VNPIMVSDKKNPCRDIHPFSGVSSGSEPFKVTLAGNLFFPDLRSRTNCSHGQGIHILNSSQTPDTLSRLVAVLTFHLFRHKYVLLSLLAKKLFSV